MTIRWLLISSLVICWLGLEAILAPLGHPGGNGSPPVSGGTYLILSKDFWEAMQNLNKGGVTYGDRQEALLEQIAVSSQFAVKTNLTLIKQNDQIIHLLEELNRRQLQEGR
ncbi:MAG: hypothetical protein PHW74_01850 [Desulfobacca sp.]|nr:hypothetical protein [Desulfobacca sp.]